VSGGRKRRHDGERKDRTKKNVHATNISGGVLFRRHCLRQTQRLRKGA
jgi:hypothetical protein